jgi:predicted RNase H-like HicB family nuclease
VNLVIIWTMKRYNFSVVIEEDKDGFFAFCPELQGCYTQGVTYEEALSNIKDAIKLHLADRGDKEKIETSRSISLSTVEVAV